MQGFIPNPKQNYIFMKTNGYWLFFLMKKQMQRRTYVITGTDFRILPFIVECDVINELNVACSIGAIKYAGNR